MKKIYIILLASLSILTGCATSSAVHEHTLADGTVIRSQFVQE